MSSVRDNMRSLRIVVRLDPRWTWRWHKWLIDELVADGHEVALSLDGRAAPLPAGLRLLLRVEKLLYRIGGEHACDLLAPADLTGVPQIERHSYADTELVVDLAGDISAFACKCRILRPLYDGAAGDAALIDRVLDSARPYLSIDDSARTGPLRVGLPAIEQPETVMRSLDNVYSRVAGALLRHVRAIALRRDGGNAREAPILFGEAPRQPSASRAAAFVMARLAGKIAYRLRHLVRTEPRWGVGWRFAGADAVRNGGELSIDAYTRLPDDGQRFYADPFVLWRDGVHHVFVEDYPFATERGVISHFTIDANGVASQPHMVLSRPYHLSYPCVFEHAGDVWMIPETSANATVELYRAQSFPDIWTREAVLLDGVKVEDATPVQHDGAWWLMGVVSEWQSSRWDALGLFSAPDLMGPWQAHAGNPLLLDARSARPAGAVFRRDGALWRPAQDCSNTYGGGLTLARIDRMDAGGYAQTIERRFAPAGTGGLIGLHTLNEDKGLEVIDFFGWL